MKKILPVMQVQNLLIAITFLGFVFFHVMQAGRTEGYNEPIILNGSTHASNCSAVTNSKAMAASLSVVPS